MTLPRWLDAEVKTVDGIVNITIKQIKWWGWPFVLILLVRQVIREAK